METVFIGIIPSEPERSHLGKLMEKYSTALHSSRALVFPPHVTIVGSFQTERCPALVKALTAFAKNIKPFSVTLPCLGHFAKPHPILYFAVDKTPLLQNLHEAALELSVGFRTDWKREDLAKAATTAEERTLVERYGSPFVKQFYHPHLTLAGPDIDPEKFESLVAQANEKPLTIHAQAITLLRKIDELWTIDRSFPLGQP